MKSKLKRAIAALSAAAMLIGMIPSGSIAYATATVDVTLTTSNKMVTFTAEDCESGCNGHIITQNVQSGQLVEATIIVESGTHIVTFSGLNLTSAKVAVMPSATMNLTLTGTNTIQGSECGIYVPEGATLVIDGSGSLNVSANYYDYAAGIGGAYYAPNGELGNRNCGMVVINDGNITATGGSYSAGIGGAEADFDTKIPGNGGNITINGGNVTATGGGDSYYGGAGIGGGNYGSKSGSGGTLTINGGNVTLTAGHSTAYGFGRGSGSNSNAGTLTLADASYLDENTTLDPNGTYFITADPTEDMIAVPDDLVYTGNLLDVSGIKIDDSKTGTATYFNQTFTVNASADGWERSFSPAEVKEVENYTVTFTKGGKSISKTFTVAECPHTGLVYAPLADGKHGGTCPLCGTDVSEEHKIIAVDKKEPTCTEDGNIAYWKCNDCGTYFSDANGKTEIEQSKTVISATGHKYSDGKCTVCGTFEDGIGAKLAGHSISLDGNIGVNFYMELDESVIENKEAYMQFTLPNGDTQNVNIGEAKTETVDEKQYYVFSCNVAPKEITDIITAQIITSDSRKGTVYEYSVMEYIDYIFTDINNDGEYTYDEKTRNLVGAMMFYGEMAREYFNPVASEPSSDSGLDKLTAETLKKFEKQISGELPDGITYYGSSLLLESNTTVRHYFKVKEDMKDEYTFIGQKNGYCYTDISNIPAGQLATPQKTTIGDDWSISYSPMSYVYSVLDSNSENKNLVNLCKALYLYQQAAAEYQNK